MTKEKPTIKHEIPDYLLMPYRIPECKLPDVLESPYRRFADGKEKRRKRRELERQKKKRR